MSLNITTMDFVEQLTGIKFLPDMSAAKESAVTASELWPVTTWPNDLIGNGNASLPDS